jgi:hypothetical protein
MKSLKPTLFILFSLCFFSISTAQQQCGFDIQREKQLQDPNFAALEKAAESKIQKAISSNDFSRMPSSVLTIPVVVHVLHLGEAVGTGTNISDAQIQSSIENLNYFYRGQNPASPTDFQIEFSLAQRDPSCNTTTGINRIDASGVPNYTSGGVSFAGAGADETVLKNLSRWPETDYFNIWIVTEIDGNNGGSGYQGYANFYNGNAYEGSVMMHSVFGHDPTNANPSWPLNFSRDNSTVVHEAGHYFHLYHTFQGDGSGEDCPGDVTVGTDSDGCADTVPHKRETSTCPTINDCTGNLWIDNKTINNIMSYYRCSDVLTEDQRTRVRAVMEGTSIVSSNGSEPFDPGYIQPTAVCMTNTVSSYASGILSVELNGNTINSSDSARDGGNIDKTDCSSSFEIDATISNTLNVGLYEFNIQQLGVWIDWNNDGDFNDNAEQQHFSQDIPENTMLPIVLTFPTTIPYGDYVRIRLITDVDDRYTGVGLITSACYSSLAYGQSEDYAVYVQPSGSITYTYNTDDDWLPTNPAGVATLSDAIVISTGIANISANTNCNTLTVHPGAALTIDSGVTVTATSIDLNSTSQLFSSLISDGTITGTVNYNRHVAQVAPVGTNDLISAPVVGQTFGSFDTANTNLVASGTLRAFAPYNTASGSYENYDTTINASTILDAGKGYRVATTDGSTLTFTGTVRTNDVLDVPISDASAGSGWNLIGNPYPSYIDFNTFFNTNTSEFDAESTYQAIYGYDGDASNGWVVWNLATIADDTITELIAPGQAFFVKSKAGGGSVNFTTEMRRAGSSDDFINGRQPLSNVALCKLKLQSAVNESSTNIYFIEGSTRGLDVGYDAGSYTGNTAEFSIFSNLVEENTGLDMAIQALPYNDFNAVSVPLGINAEAGVELTVGVDDISTLPSNINVYLEDTVQNTWTLLNNTDYTFTPNIVLNGTGRFFIRYSSVTLSTNANNRNDLIIYATSNPKELVIKGQLSRNTEAALYDIQGRLVIAQKLDAFSSLNSIDVSRVSKGIYIVKVSNQNQIKTQKLIIK